MRLNIVHITSYEYAAPVAFGPHRLMLRPAEGHDVQITASRLAISPEHRIRWIHDVFQNSVALVEFTAPAAELRIESGATVTHYETNPFDFVLEPGAVRFPFVYDPAEAFDLAPWLHREHPGDDAAIRQWVRPFLDANGGAQTLDFLAALNRAVPRMFAYRRREEYGVQPPGETLQSRSGSCRDFAWLFIETARALGLAARFVSGYLCEPSAAPGAIAAGSTHAWAEIYLPGAGWKGFDPTSGVLTAQDHVRVAAGRLPAHAAPVTGTFRGDPSAFRRLGVEVRVTRADS